MITEYLTKLKLQDYLSHQKEKDTLYVTDLLRCPLKIHFEEKYKELAISEVYTPSTILGDLVHKGLESLDKIDEYKVNAEVDGKKEIQLLEENRKITIKGRADIILDNGNEKIIVEIKSARADKGIPHKHHIMQLQAYLWLFNISKGILLYVTPDRITEFDVKQPLDDASIIKLVQENFALSPSPRFPWECKYCVFSVLCPNKKNA
ncbi:CRISPR-associated protein Cas4 [Acidianus sulfidivorans JP7]|uniref:CRISPR-associated exonuclease Cas4 n=1 Tax=Acidianus sulfidivorans JP7 TaxID=619593 RepID=A0A2U9IN50_9CREN|nr:CRISPR-associated protein Cas4 [Acidianus sulfidivorans]AWR97499.1 CRISPR-associated protein Cas4 [Acidianus sulfidivorans JP7]